MGSLEVAFREEVARLPRDDEAKVRLLFDGECLALCSKDTGQALSKDLRGWWPLPDATTRDEHATTLLAQQPLCVADNMARWVFPSRGGSEELRVADERMQSKRGRGKRC